MSELNAVLYSEWMKLKRSKIIVTGVLGTCIVPLLVIFHRVQQTVRNPGSDITLFELYDSAVMFLMLLFGPLVLSVIAAQLISREYSERTLKTIFAVPISRKKFLTGKFLILFMLVMLFMLLSWFCLLILAAAVNLFFNVSQITVISAGYFLFQMLYGGILLYMTITPVIYLCIRSKGAMTSFIAAASVCLFNVILSNSAIAGFYPWTASYLLVSGGRNNGNFGCPPSFSLVLIVLVFAVSFIGSMRRFLSDEIS